MVIPHKKHMYKQEKVQKEKIEMGGYAADRQHSEM
jgi:hypothetical protein